MVTERETDGVRLAQLLASELDGHERGPLGQFVVTNAKDADELRPVEAPVRAYDVERNGERIARVFVHPDRVHVAFERSLEAVVAKAEAQSLRVRPKATDPPRALVFVEDGAQVKWILDVFVVALDG